MSAPVKSESLKSRGGTTTSGPSAQPVALKILECVGHDSFKNYAKKRNDCTNIPRESCAVFNADNAWINYTKKWSPVNFFDMNDQPCRVDKSTSMQLEITGVTETGEKYSAWMTTTQLQGLFWFRSAEFSTPGNYTFTYTLPGASKLGYQITPLIIHVHISSYSESPKKAPVARKKIPKTPPTPSTATNTRRAKSTLNNSSIDSDVSNPKDGTISSRSRSKMTRVGTPEVEEEVIEEQVASVEKVPKPRGRPRIHPKPETNLSSNTPIASSTTAKRKRSHSTSNLPVKNIDMDNPPQKVPNPPEDVESAYLDRNMFLTSVLSTITSGAEVDLSNILTPTLQTVLLDDVHDVHVRAFRQEQFQKLNVTQKNKKNVLSKASVEPPSEVFLSAFPALSSSVGLKWSVYGILHDSQFSSFISKKLSSVKRKKTGGQLNYYVNTLLVAFESLCFISRDNVGEQSSSLANSPVFYQEERESLESNGILERVAKSNEEFLYHHCNARHLLRVLLLLLLSSPKYSPGTSQSDSRSGKDDSESSGFLDFVECTLEYLSDHAFPLLYQH